MFNINIKYKKVTFHYYENLTYPEKFSGTDGSRLTRSDSQFNERHVKEMPCQRDVFMLQMKLHVISTSTKKYKMWYFFNQVFNENPGN